MFRLAEFEITSMVTMPIPGTRVFELVAFNDDLRVHICSAEGMIEALTIDYRVQLPEGTTDDDLETAHDIVSLWDKEVQYFGEELLKSVVCTVPKRDIKQIKEELEIEDALDGRIDVLEKIAEYHSANCYY
jgi:hypothetical protein